MYPRSRWGMKKRFSVGESIWARQVSQPGSIQYLIFLSQDRSNRLLLLRGWERGGEDGVGVFMALFTLLLANIWFPYL